MIFQDRREAGQLLSSYLTAYKKRTDAIVLGLARGGVVVAYEIAKALSLPLNVLVPRKIGVPDNPEVAMGAISEDGEILLNREIVDLAGATPSMIHQEVEKEKRIAGERILRYRKAAPLGNLKGKTILLVDDGVATGATILVEIQSLRKKGVASIVVVAPVAATEAWGKIKAAADDAVCIDVREDFFGVSGFYREFDPVEDATVLLLLKNLFFSIEHNQHGSEDE